jgi:hypothetical protein
MWQAQQVRAKRRLTNERFSFVWIGTGMIPIAQK